MSIEIGFVDLGNREFLENRSSKPTSKQEILANLANSSGTVPFVRFNNRRIQTQSLMIGLLLIMAGGLFFLKIVLEFFIRPSGDVFADIPLGLASLTSSIFVIMMMGYGLLLSYYVNERSKQYVNSLYSQIIEDRYILFGQITHISQSLSKQQIMYSFSFPETNELILGKYVTSSPSNLPLGSTIAVLYLNKRIHVLL